METSNAKLDQGKLKSVTDSSHTATTVMVLFALRERARAFSNIAAIKQELIRMGEKIVDEDYKKFWQGLQAAGVGSIVFGRRNNPDRFQWHYSLKNVAKIAIEGKEEALKELAQKMPKESKPVKKAVRKRNTFKAERMFYSIPLRTRKGVVVELIVPKEVSASELVWIKDALGR